MTGNPTAQDLFRDYAEKAMRAQATLSFDDGREAGLAWARFLAAFKDRPAEVVQLRREVRQ